MNIEPLGECEWFALCSEPAVDRRPHPILGSVPVCERHLHWHRDGFGYPPPHETDGPHYDWEGPQS